MLLLFPRESIAVKPFSGPPVDQKKMFFADCPQAPAAPIGPHSLLCALGLNHFV